MKRILTLSGVFISVLFLLVGGLWVSLVNFLPQDFPRGGLTVGLGVVFAGLFLWDMIDRLRHVLAGPNRLRLQLGLTALNIVLLLLAFAFVFFQFGIIDTTRPGSPIVAGAGGTRGVVPSDWLSSDDGKTEAKEDAQAAAQGEGQPSDSKSESKSESSEEDPQPEEKSETQEPQQASKTGADRKSDKSGEAEPYGSLHQFALCFYFSVVTFTTLGYGDFQPIGWGRAVAGLEAFVGYLVLGILASTASTLLQSAAQERSE